MKSEQEINKEIVGYIMRALEICRDEKVIKFPVTVMEIAKMIQLEELRNQGLLVNAYNK